MGVFHVFKIVQMYQIALSTSNVNGFNSKKIYNNED